MNIPLALIVDDEPDLRDLVKITLKKMNIEAIDAANVAAARAALKKYHFDLCLTDMRLPDGTGLEIVEYIQKDFPSIPVAVVTAFGSMELAITSLKAGAFDFVSKPVDIKILRNLVTTALKLNSTVPLGVDATIKSDTLLGKTPIMKELRAKINKLSRSQAPVYISGESGTGKELVARLIHQLGPRAEFPFIPVNCGAIPEHLMEGEFFGHKKGSFTGATADKQGLFQAAQKGTLFLDEVADLPLHMQVKLLRAIQEKAIRPIGDQHELPVDIRILSATHKNLQQLVEEGSFRQDLFYRINVIELAIPSLQERKEDILLLTEHTLEQLSIRSGLPKARLSPEATQLLMSYSFPGNIRELENILERAMTLCENSLITANDLQLRMGKEILKEEIANKELPLTNYIDEIERKKILAALEATHWNKTKAASLLGISFRALRYRLKKLNMDRGE